MMRFSNPRRRSKFLKPKSASNTAVVAPLLASAMPRFAKSFNSFLSFKRALYGFFENSKLSHLGPPHAPSITASDSKDL